MPEPLVVGVTASLTGDVTRLRFIAGRSPSTIETMLGYGPGRLREGYWIVVLIEPLRLKDVIFAGLTLRSGGREGKPLHDPDADARRLHVYETMLRDYGSTHVDHLREELVSDPTNLRGENRIAKIVPVTHHVGKDPAAEYPMGGGAPQFTMTAPHRFRVAAAVDRKAVATTAAGWSVNIGNHARYEDRAKLNRYLVSF